MTGTDPKDGRGPEGVTSFLRRLRERKLVQWGLAYLAGAWVVLQGTAILAEPFGWPGWIQRAVTVLLAVGFAGALVLAWYHGEQGRQAIGRVEGIMLVALLVIAGGVLALVRPGGEADATSGSVPGAGLEGTGGEVEAGVGSVPGAGVGSPDGLPAESFPDDDPRPGVAVLPFAALGGGEESEAFALGVHDDVLTQLSGIDALRVISRTSVMAYRETSGNVREIARELGVANVLEGGVQRAGDRVRLNVQLIDAVTDAHLWSERFDRRLTAENVFTIQAEIARAVASALRAELTSEEDASLDRTPTRSLVALDYYHRGSAHLQRAGDDRADTLAVRMFERAVSEDPGFLRAWSALTRARSWLVRMGRATTSGPARRALERARELDPDAPETALADGYYHYYARGDYGRALEAFSRAEADRPGDAATLEALGLIHRRLGHWEETLAYEESARRNDPVNPLPNLNAAATLSAVGERERAAALVDRTILADPGYAAARFWKVGHLLWVRGDTAGARSFLDASRDVVGEEAWRWRRSQIAWVVRDWARAAEHARPLPAIDGARIADLNVNEGAQPPPRQLLLARIHRRSGDERSARAHADSVLAVLRKVDPDSVPEIFGQRASLYLALARAHAYRGDVDVALALADRAGASFGPEVDAIDGPLVLFARAEVHAAVGDRAGAMELLEELFSGRPTPVPARRLRLDPSFDVLREEPRFRALVARVAP